MPNRVTWCTRPPEVTADGDGVIVSYISGEESLRMRMSRHMFLAALHKCNGIAAQWKCEDVGRIVGFSSG